MVNNLPADTYTHRRPLTVSTRRHDLLFFTFSEYVPPIYQTQKLRRNISRTIMKICVHCADYDSLFLRAFTVMCWMRSSAMTIQAMSSLLSYHWGMNKKHWSLNPGTPAFHSTVGVICRRGHSGSSTPQSAEFTLVRKKLRGALGSNQIFMRMAYLNENFLLCVYAHFDSTSYSTVIDAHRCKPIYPYRSEHYCTPNLKLKLIFYFQKDFCKTFCKIL